MLRGLRKQFGGFNPQSSGNSNTGRVTVSYSSADCSIRYSSVTMACAKLYSLWENAFFCHRKLDAVLRIYAVLWAHPSVSCAFYKSYRLCFVNGNRYCLFQMDDFRWPVDVAIVQLQRYCSKGAVGQLNFRLSKNLLENLIFVEKNYSRYETKKTFKNIFGTFWG